MLEFRNRITYGMNHTLVKYIEEESEWDYIPNITQHFHLWVSWNFFCILQPNIWRFVISIYESSIDWNLVSWHKKFIPLSLEYIPIVFSYLQCFPVWKSLKSIWSLYNIYSTNFNNVCIKIFFSLFVELFSKHYWDAPSGAPACSPLVHMWNPLNRILPEKSKKSF